MIRPLLLAFLIPLGHFAIADEKITGTQVISAEEFDTITDTDIDENAPSFATLVDEFESNPDTVKYRAIWDHYIANGGPNEYNQILIDIPELKDRSFSSSERCPEIIDRVNLALELHYPSLALHYLALRCSEGLGDSERANREEVIVDVITDLMINNGSGESDADPYWVGDYTDVDQFMALAGIEVIDKYLQTYNDDTFFQWVLYEDSETGLQDYYHFDCTDYFTALLIGAEKPQISDNPIADAIFRSNWDTAIPIAIFAEAGIPEAQILMGNLSVDMVKQFPEFVSSALSYYASASRQGSVIAKGLYASAIFTLQNKAKYAEAIEYLIDATEKNYQYATYLLTMTYLLDVDGNDDEQLADQLIQLLAQNQPIENVYFKLGEHLTEAFGRLADNDLGIDFYEKAADLGHAEAAYTLGLKYFYGRDGISESHKKGLRWMQRAAAMDSPGANVELSYLYLGNNDIDEDHEKALLFAKRGAELGEFNGYNNLATIYDRIYSGHYNAAAAAENFKKSVEQGSNYAKYHLAVKYLIGSGIELDFLKAYQLSEELIADNDKNGYLLQAHMYQNGWHLEQDINKARELYLSKTNSALILSQYNKALLHTPEHAGIAALNRDIDDLKRRANSNATDALLLGFYHDNGYLTKKNINKARKFYQKAGDLGLAVGYALYADTYNGLTFYSSDKKKLRKYHKKAYDNGYHYSALQLAESYLHNADKDDFQIAFEYLKIAAAQQQPRAMLLLAKAHENGQGTVRDLKLALETYEKAYELGNLEAARQLGWLYAQNKTYGNIDNAIKYYTAAAENGHTNSMHAVARLHHNYYKNFLDIDKAVYWYTRAEEKGHHKAGVALGQMYLTGAGVDANTSVGLLYLNKYVRKSNYDAFFWLARAMQHGLGLELDIDKAEDLYEQLVDLKHANATNNYAFILHQKSNGNRGYRRAMRYFKSADKRGSITAKLNIGWMLEHGQGVGIDINKALDYYIAAAIKGSSCALYRLVLVAKNGEMNEPVNMEKAKQFLREIEAKRKSRSTVGIQDCLVEIPEDLSELHAELFDDSDATTGITVTQSST